MLACVGKYALRRCSLAVAARRALVGMHMPCSLSLSLSRASVFVIWFIKNLSEIYLCYVFLGIPLMS